MVTKIRDLSLKIIVIDFIESLNRNELIDMIKTSVILALFPCQHVLDFIVL